MDLFNFCIYSITSNTMERRLLLYLISNSIVLNFNLSQLKTNHFCETRSKRSVEVYKGKNLHPTPPAPPTDVTDVAIETSQTRQTLLIST